MFKQITLKKFAEALTELGHDPKIYHGRKLSLDKLCEIYDIDAETIYDAALNNELSVYYDYPADLAWVDALEAAHFFYCIKSRKALYSRSL